ncbi:unnamed protein product [Caenorhabditis brenneri]
MSSSLEAVVKNAEEIAEGVIPEEIIEEVIEEEQVEWMGPQEEEEEIYYQERELLHHHQMVGYDEADDPYQSFLPVRNGDAYFSLNLPDLLSKPYQIPQENGNSVRLILCFNKKCQRQVAFDGCLYTIKGYVSETQWNTWRCINEQCFGEIQTTPEFTEIRLPSGHNQDCSISEELQIAIRIAVYDMRLLAEFTDAPLEDIYMGGVNKIKAEFPDGVILFPQFETLEITLKDHRLNKIYRKRFEMQKFRDKQKRMNMTPDEVLFAENSSGLIKFRRTKPFPPSLCNECNDHLISTNLPSQDQLISHYMYNHNRRMTIERYEFKDVSAFDQYLRELNSHSRYKLKRMGLADENMYYLCSHDDRLAKTGVGRASRLQSQNCHCTAFIRVFDWRIVSKREGARIMIDYCLEHQPHVYEPEPYQQRQQMRRDGTYVVNPPTFQKEFIDYYTPEVFMRDIEDRRIRSQKILLGELPVVLPPERDAPKRPVELKPYLPSARMKVSFGARSLAPPYAAQIAAGSTQPYVDPYREMESPHRLRQKQQRLPIRSYQKVEVERGEPMGHVEQQNQPSTSNSSGEQAPPPRIYITQKPYSRLTERQNFKDIYTFNAICKVEDTCLSILNRLQSCQHAKVGLAYREKLLGILRNANNDLGLVDGSTEEEWNTSWALQKPVRGRPRKRARLDGDEEDTDGDMEFTQGDDDVEEEKEHPETSEKDEKPVLSPQKCLEQEQEPVEEEPVEEPMEAEQVEEPVEELEPVEPVHSPLEAKPEPQPQDLTTRSGRARKPPARLAEN